MAAASLDTAPRDLNSALNRLYHDKVQIDQQEAKKYREIAFSNVDKIIEYVNRTDPRFSREPVRAGSYWQGLRVGKADEYDYSIVLDGIGDLHWGGGGYHVRNYGFNRPVPTDLDTIPDDLDIVSYGSSSRSGVPSSWQSAGLSATTRGPTSTQFPSEPTLGYTFAPLKEKLPWGHREDLVRDDDIVPFLVRKRLKTLLTNAKRDLNLRGEVRQSRKVNSPALTLIFKAGEKEMSIDFAPLIRAHLSFKSDFGWPRNARWPGSRKVEAIKRLGVNLIAKKDFWWMYVFVDAEKELVSGIDSDGGKRKETHRLMKMINRDIWCPTTKPVVTSYILKNIWFWEMESLPDTSDWTTDQIASRVLGMTDRVIHGIKAGNIKQYFQPAFNLLASKEPADLNIALRKIQKFKENSFENILKLLNQ